MDRRKFLKSAAAAPAAIAATQTTAFAAGTRPSLDRDRLRRRNSDRSTVVCQNGMVCTSQPLAAMAGIDVLKAGGNCVDAAIATNAMLGLTEPGSDGIGGDLFAILWSESDQGLFGLNASGRAPYAWSLDEARARGVERIPRESPLSWTVPGCVSGWGLLNERSVSSPLSATRRTASRFRRSSRRRSSVIGAEMVSTLTWQASTIRMARYRHSATFFRTRCWRIPTGKSPREARQRSTKAR
jgi:gamma-glutamyltranspeptidase/glutathione hydrolase